MQTATNYPLPGRHSTRAPAHIELAGGKSKRQRVWEAIRARKGVEWTTSEIANAAGVDATAVRTYLTALRAGGYIEATGAGKRARRYRLANDVGIDAPRVTLTGQPITLGSAQQQMWQTLRITGQALSPAELSGLASTERVPVTLTVARDYLGYLNRAGYLAVAGGRYRLTKNTGPRAPMVQRTKRVYDPNSNSVAMQEVDDGDI